MIKMELLKVDNQGFVGWLRSGNQEMCLIGERHEHAYFRHSLSNGLDILYMYDYMRDGKIPLHREPEYQGLYKRDTKELYDVSYDLNKAIEGTDKCIKRGAKLAKRNAVVVKVAKPKQDQRFDIPAIGMRTLRTMSSKKASLIAVEANETIIVDQEKVIKYADEHNIVIMAV